MPGAETEPPPEADRRMTPTREEPDREIPAGGTDPRGCAPKPADGVRRTEGRGTAPGTSSSSKSASCSTSGGCSATVKGEGAWALGISQRALPSSEKEEKKATLIISFGLRLECSNLMIPRGGCTLSPSAET